MIDSILKGLAKGADKECDSDTVHYQMAKYALQLLYENISKFLITGFIAYLLGIFPYFVFFCSCICCIKIGLNIAYYRKLKNWTQEQLAEKAHLSRNLIGHIEAPDMIKSFKLTTLFSIADALEVPPYKLLEFRD